MIDNVWFYSQNSVSENYGPVNQRREEHFQRIITREEDIDTPLGSLRESGGHMKSCSRGFVEMVGGGKQTFVMT